MLESAKRSGGSSRIPVRKSLSPGDGFMKLEEGTKREEGGE
jgi:hypothetical protein